MYRVAICDDEAEQREQVRQRLLALSIKSGIEFEITLFSSGSSLLAHYQEERQPFHIWILDIEMPGMSGIDTARSLRTMKQLDEQIIFLTSYAEYMLESFDVVTFQYLLKPISNELFEEKLLKLCRFFEDHAQQILIIKAGGGGDLVLRHEEIIAIEAVKSLSTKHKLHVITVHGVQEGRGLISSYAEALRPHRFLQIHRSVLIHMLHVRKFSGNTVVMSSGLELPIGRSKIKEVKDAYTKFMILGMGE